MCSMVIGAIPAKTCTSTVRKQDVTIDNNTESIYSAIMDLNLALMTMDPQAILAVTITEALLPFQNLRPKPSKTS